MKILNKSNSFRRGILLYRKMRYSGGHGVHSPFVYSLISKVINVKCAFYCQSDIERIRKEAVCGNDARLTAIARKESITPKCGALLLRLANFFKPERILQMGSGAGVSTLYLSSYSKNTKCTVIERSEEAAFLAKSTIEKYNNNSINMIVGEYREELPEVLSRSSAFDFIFLNMEKSSDDNDYAFRQCLPKVEESSVMIINGIKKSKGMRSFWKTVTENPATTVTIDLYFMGLVFFNKKLHKRNYTVYF
jgi:Predicted O-methyltransferase